jgi:hypothetical protein
VRLTTRVGRLIVYRARETSDFPPPGLQRLIATVEYGSASLVGYAINCFDDICPLRAVARPWNCLPGLRSPANRRK